MQPFRVHKGRAVPLYRPNIDTDQIIPKQFLKRIEKTGFGEFVFYDWRRGKDGQLDPEFTLNQPRYAGASILLAAKNFGCGSSREHAVWALADFGFRVVIAPTFGDIFANNCVQNGVLTVALTEDEVADLVKRSETIPGYELTVDLEKRKVTDDRGFSASFAVDETVRHRLLEGLDDIGLTMQHEAEIAAYEARHAIVNPVI
jgi:3-isopropylmalate/(R)-2-methylmalate dehydratase small subunit